MHPIIKRVGVGLVAAVLCGLCCADELPFKEGAIVQVSSIRTKEGKFMDYWNFLSTQWHQEMEQAKKDGLVLSYDIYQANPRTPHDPDLYLVVTYANYAALDGLDEKMAAIDKKIWGSLNKAAQTDAERESIRTVLGSEMIQKLDFRN
jgi:hypothetical protein